MPTPPVVILGAGMAGLAAAYQLKTAGIPILVLEGRDRAGGRVRTLDKYFDDDLYVDLGAENVPNIHYRLQSYLKTFGVSLIPSVNSALQKVLWIQGNRIFLRPQTPVLWPHGLQGVTPGQSLDATESAFFAPLLAELGDPADPGWPHPEGLQFDELSTGNLLRSKGATAQQLKLFQVGINSLDGNGFDVNSALFQLASANSFRGFQTTQFVAGGTQTLPDKMAASLSDVIRFNSRVRAIVRDSSCFDVTYQDATGELVQRCENLIVTIPYSVLKRDKIIRFDVESKKAVIDQLPTTSVTRTFLQFSRRVWEDVGLSGDADTDRQIMSVYPVVREAGNHTKQGILESYTAGKTARDMAALSEDERLKIILEQLEVLFPGVSKCYKKSYCIKWDDDEWARGAYVFYEKGQGRTLYPFAATPVGKMVFAGDHTTPSAGWMENAIQSGERAAREVISAL